jgi:hypothetical protein
VILQIIDGPMKKITAIYARYSSHAQDGGTSIEVQIETCTVSV